MRRIFRGFPIGCLVVLLLAVPAWLSGQAAARRFFESVEVHRGRFLLGAAITQVFEGATNNDFETTLTVTDPTADRTITLPNTTGVAMVASSALTMVAGTVATDTDNPTSVATGLAAITSCTIENLQSAAPADDPNSFTILTTASQGRLDIYQWKNTSGTDPTQTASTLGGVLVAYICVGTT